MAMTVQNIGKSPLSKWYMTWNYFTFFPIVLTEKNRSTAELVAEVWPLWVHWWWRLAPQNPPSRRNQSPSRFMIRWQHVSKKYVWITYVIFSYFFKDSFCIFKHLAVLLGKLWFFNRVGVHMGLMQFTSPSTIFPWILCFTWYLLTLPGLASLASPPSLLLLQRKPPRW